MPERELGVVGAPVVVVDAERLLELRLVRRLRDRDHARVDVGHVVAARPGRSRSRARADAARRPSAAAAPPSSPRRRRRPRRRRCSAPRAPRRSTTTSVTERPAASVSSRSHARVRAQLDVRGAPAPAARSSTCASALPSARHGKPSKRSQRTQRPASGSDSFRSTPTGRWNGRWPVRSKSSCELLDARLVRDGRVRERARAPRLGRVLAALPVHEVEPLGLGVVGLEVGVGERPGGRDAAVVADLVEVALAQAEQDRAVELRVAADEVLLVGLELARRPCRSTSRPTGSGRG